MKKNTFFLSLAMIFGLSISLFAEIPQDMSKDCFIPPQSRENRDYTDELTFIYDIDIAQQDFIFYEREFSEPERSFNKRFFDDNRYTSCYLKILW